MRGGKLWKSFKTRQSKVAAILLLVILYVASIEYARPDTEYTFHSYTTVTNQPHIPLQFPSYNVAILVLRWYDGKTRTTAQFKVWDLLHDGYKFILYKNSYCFRETPGEIKSPYNKKILRASSFRAPPAC